MGCQGCIYENQEYVFSVKPPYSTYSLAQDSGAMSPQSWLMDGFFCISFPGSDNCPLLIFKRSPVIHHGISLHIFISHYCLLSLMAFAQPSFSDIPIADLEAKAAEKNGEGNLFTLSYLTHPPLGGCSLT